MSVVMMGATSGSQNTKNIISISVRTSGIGEFPAFLIIIFQFWEFC